MTIIIFKDDKKYGTQNVNVMRVSAGFRAAAHCCNTANSSLSIDGKIEILNKRIGYVQTGTVSTSKSQQLLANRLRSL